MRSLQSELKEMTGILQQSIARIRNKSFVEKNQAEERKDIWSYKPVSPVEFIRSPHFINDQRGRIWPSIIEDMDIIFSKPDKLGNPCYFPSVHVFLNDSGIGSGKSTAVALFNTYMTYLILCLKDPLDYFELFDSSLLIQNVAPTEEKAKAIVFAKTTAMIKRCSWFRETGNLPESRMKSKMKFYKHINTEGMTEKELTELDKLEASGKAETMPALIIAPGSSSISSVTGADLLMGIVDEACSDGGFETHNEDKCGPIFLNMNERRISRFMDDGMVACISSAGSEERWMEREITRLEVFRKQHGIPDSQKICEMDGLRYMYCRRPSYEANPKYQVYFDEGRTFSYKAVRETEDGTTLENYLTIPDIFKKKFEIEPETSLKNICSIPTLSTYRWISDWKGIISNINTSRSDPCPDNGRDSPLTPEMVQQSLDPSWMGEDGVLYYVHIDLATGGTSSSGKDGVGLCIGHRGKDVQRGEQDHEKMLATVVIDLAVRFKSHGKGVVNKDGSLSASEQDIKFSDIRKFIFWAHNSRNFQFAKITFDGFQSTDSIQIFNEAGYLCEKNSVDNASFDTMRSLWYDGRLDIFHDAHALWELRRLERKVNGKIEKSVGASDDEIESVAKVCELCIEGEEPEVYKPRARGYSTSGVAGQKGMPMVPQSGTRHPILQTQIPVPRRGMPKLPHVRKR